jgi:hypothetical protein
VVATHALTQKVHKKEHKKGPIPTNHQNYHYNATRTTNLANALFIIVMAILGQTANKQSKSGGGSRKQRKTMDRSKKSRKRSGGCSDSEYDDPPVLNITIDNQDYVHVPVRRKNGPDASKEFAIAAKDAVKTQIESREQSYCQLSPSLMAPTDALEIFRSAEVHEIMLDRELPYAGNTVRTTDLAAKHSGEHGYLMFVIRRPGKILLLLLLLLL